MTIVLSSHPLSLGFLEKIRLKIGKEFESYSLSEIKRTSIIQLLRFFRQKGAHRIYLAFEDNSAPITRPAMELIAFLSGVPRVFILFSDLKIQRLSRLRVFYQLLMYPLITLISLFDLASFTFCLLRLKNLSRVDNVSFEKQEVLYLKSNLWFGVKAGGSVGHISGVVNSFLKKGWKVNFFSIEKPKMVGESVNFFNVPFPRPYIYPPDLNNISYHQVLWKVVLKISRNLRFKGIIYQRMSVFNFSGVVISRILKCPLVLEYNGSEVWISKNWGKPPLFSRIAELTEEVCLQHSHKIITVSNVLKEELLARGVEDSRIVVYPNCIDESVYDDEAINEASTSAVRKRFGIASEDYVATFMGTFGIWHGVDVLAQAIKTLVDNHYDFLIEQKLKFLLVGDGFMMSNVKTLIGFPKYEKFVRFAGLVPQEEGPQILASSDLLLSPHKPNFDGSRFFGSPTKLFEYMGMRRPIIASSLEQLSEVISPAIPFESLKDDSFTVDAVGVLVEPGDSDQLTHAIMKITSERSRFYFLGKNAREKAVTYYTWDIHVQKILDSVSELLRPAHKTKVSINLKKVFAATYYMIGPLPPPLGGVSVFVQRYTRRIARHFKVLNIDLKKMGKVRSVAFLFRLIFNPRFMVIHLNSGNMAVLGLLYFRFFPTYIRVHDHSERKIETYNLLQKGLLNLFLQRIDEIILVGDHLRAYYARHGIRLPKKFRSRNTFLPPDLSEEASIVATYPDALNSFVGQCSPLVVINAYRLILYNGVDLYGLDLAVEMLDQLRMEFPKIGLIIALADSTDTTLLGDIHMLIQRKALSERVFFLTDQRQLWPLFRKVDLLVRPTASDGFGVSVAEALYFGASAVASDVCKRPEGTILFANRDLEQFIQKCREALSPCL